MYCVPGILHALFNVHNNPTKWVRFIPIVQMMTLRLGEVKLPPLQGHTASKAEDAIQTRAHLFPQHEASR